jgi:hypothetical protein
MSTKWKLLQGPVLRPTVLVLFAVNSPCQSTPLLNFFAAIFDLTLPLTDCFLLGQPLISDGNAVSILRLVRTPCRFTPLLNVSPLIFGLTLFGRFVAV